jgi:uncharacterized protein YndB with AHSA1/START domain
VLGKFVRDIELDIDIEVPLHRAWELLVDPKSVREWLGCINFEPTVGHIFFMQPDAVKASAKDTTGATHCRITAIEPPTTLAFAWYFPGTPETDVEITLEPLGPERTKMRLSHRGWDRFPADAIGPIRDQLDGGWRSGAIPSFKRFAESHR